MKAFQHSLKKKNKKTKQNKKVNIYYSCFQEEYSNSMCRYYRGFVVKALDENTCYTYQHQPIDCTKKKKNISP